MSNLKDDLNSYLSRSSGPSTSLSSLAASFKLPTLKTPFGGGGGAGTPEDEEPFLGVQTEQSKSTSSWFKKEEHTCCPSMSKKQRILGFVTSLVLGLICFGLSSAYVPLLLFKARKFSLLFSLGSVFTMASFSFLWGPWNHVTHLFSKERLPFTLVYLSTLTATLYFAMGMQSTVLTTVAAVCQLVALAWFVISYIPGGQTGLKYMTKMCSSICRSTVNKSLPI